MQRESPQYTACEVLSLSLVRVLVKADIFCSNNGMAVDPVPVRFGPLYLDTGFKSSL